MSPQPGLAVADTSVAQSQCGASIRALRDRQRHRASYGRHFDTRAERGLLQGDRNLNMNIIVLAAKEGMRLDIQLDIGIPRGPAAEARDSLSFQPQRLSVLGTLRNSHLQCLALR